MKSNTARLLLLWSLIAAAPAVAEGAEPASSPLRFTETEFDFGPIKEADGPVEHTFVFENTGTAPLVIDEVITTCGCTTAQFDRKPILPGEKSSLRFRFDPLNRPGHFAKTMTVVSGGRKYRNPLRVTGSVIERRRTIPELFPIKGPAGLRFETSTAAFGFVAQGKAQSMTVAYINPTFEELELRIDSLHPSGYLTVDAPPVVHAGGRGNITLTYRVPVGSGTYGELTDRLIFHVPGQEYQTMITVHGIVTDDFDGVEPATAPRARFERNIITFDKLSRRAQPARFTLRLDNPGSAPLRIRSVKAQPGLQTSLEAGMSVAPGASREVTVTLDPSRFEPGRLLERISLILNDPWRPSRDLRITGIITD